MSYIYIYIYVCKSKVPTDHDTGFHPKPDKCSPSNYFISLINIVTWISPVRLHFASTLRSKIPQVFHPPPPCMLLSFPSTCSFFLSSQWHSVKIQNGFHSNHLFCKFSISKNQRRTEKKIIWSGAPNGWFMQYKKRPATFLLSLTMRRSIT